MELLGNIENYLKVTNNSNLATHYDLNASKYYIATRERYTEFWEQLCHSNHDESESESKSDSDSDSDSESESIDPLANTQGIRLAEVVKKNQRIPLILEFKFEFDSDLAIDGGVYDQNFITTLIRDCQDEIKNYYMISSDNTELVCCLVEYSHTNHIVVSNDSNSICFKLHFPNLKIESSDQIYDGIVKKLYKTNLLTKLRYHPLNNWTEIITFQKNLIPIYNQAHEQLGGIYTDGGKMNNDINAFFDPTKHFHYIEGDFNPGEADILKRERWLPMFFSVYYGLRNAKKKTNESQIGIGNRLRFTLRQKDTEEQQLAKKFITLIDQDRANILYYWEDIGKALCNVYEGSNEGLRVWKKFTRLSNKYKKSDCVRMYEDYEDDNYITLKTLAWYAREDSKAAYEEWMNTEIRKAITIAITKNTDFSVSKVFQKMFGLDYVCANIEKKIWYKYEIKQHRWVKIDSAYKIRNEISTTFSNQFELYKKEFLLAINNAASQNEREQNTILRKNIIKIIYNAGTYNKKNVLVKQIADLMINEDFNEVMDSNTNLIGIRNGVIECFEDRAIFRKGKPEDYITIQSRTKYDPSMTWEHRYVKRVLEWFRKLYPDKEVNHYVWKIYSSFLQGKNIDKKLYFFTGPTNGGKSMLKKFFEQILGRYSFTLPDGAVANKKNKSSNGLRPGMALAMNSNIAWVLESTEIMSETEVKIFTGNDSVFVRMMGENGGNKTPRFKLLYVCNMPPIVIAGDSAMRERILIIPHQSIFSHDAPESEEEQRKTHIFKRDNNFERKLRRLRSAGLWIMLNYYKKYREEGLRMPALIQEATDQYWDENDIYGSFSNDKIVQTESDRPLYIDAVYSKFINWLENNYPNIETKPDKNTVKKIFAQRWKEKNLSVLDGNRWFGISLRDRNSYVDNTSFD